MAGEQLNLRMPGELAQRVRVRAAELGIRPRDVVVEALQAHFTGLSNKSEAPQRVDDGPVTARSETADQHGAAPRTPRRKGGRTATATAGEAGSSGARRGGGQQPVDASPQSRGCPECGGDLAERPNGVLVCGDCDYAVSP